MKNQWVAKTNDVASLVASALDTETVTRLFRDGWIDKHCYEFAKHNRTVRRKRDAAWQRKALALAKKVKVRE